MAGSQQVSPLQPYSETFDTINASPAPASTPGRSPASQLFRRAHSHPNPSLTVAGSAADATHSISPARNSYAPLSPTGLVGGRTTTTTIATSQTAAGGSPFGYGAGPPASPNWIGGGISPSRMSKRTGLLGSGGSGAGPRVRRRLFFDDESSDGSDPRRSHFQYAQRHGLTDNDLYSDPLLSPTLGSRNRRLSLGGQSLHGENSDEAYGLAIETIRKCVDEGHERVDLSDLGLTTVPAEICELKDLVVLVPSQTLHSSLSITLDSNLLRAFPMYLCQLRNLTVLILSRNKIEAIPPDIHHLVNLEVLSVAGNRIRALPYEVKALPKLKSLTTHPNPYFDLPPAERRRPFSHIAPCIDVAGNAGTAPFQAEEVNEDDAATMVIEEEEGCYRETAAGPNMQAWPPYHVISQRQLPTLMDLAARAILPSDLKLLDKYRRQLSAKRSPGTPTCSTKLPGTPTNLTGLAFVKGSPIPAQQSPSIYSQTAMSEGRVPNIIERVRWTMDPKYSGNKCAICRAHFLTPLLEFMVWVRAGNGGRIVPFREQEAIPKSGLEKVLQLRFISIEIEIETETMGK
ncbi:hypothetical protein EV182_002794, partial [Spiromyces aspiralis]